MITRTIDHEIAEILERATVDGRRLVLAEQLDRKTYQRVAKILELLGGRWDRKARAHVFEEDAAEVVADAVTTRVVADLRKTYQMYPTPHELADEIVELAGVQAGDTVLEPSAGTGHIVQALRRKGATVLMCEVQTRLHEELARLGEVVGTDFLTTPPRPVDRIVANPPFARGQEILHVQQMATWLQPRGGTLVTVMSPAWRFRTTEMHTRFAAWVAEHGGEWFADHIMSFTGTDVRWGVLRVQIAGQS